jgi:hypothetical protein
MATRNRRPAAASVRALGARYDAARQRVELELTNGYVVGVPVRQFAEIAAASAAQLAGVEVIGAGNVLHWELLDADYSVPAILAEGIGRHVAMRVMAGAGGRARSKAKVAAARANGKKGGRPRKRRD